MYVNILIMKYFFKVSNLSKSYIYNSSDFFFKKKITKKIIEDISFKAMEGDSIALLGKNGSGKTTLLKIISGLLTADKGIIENSLNLPFDHTQISMVNSNDRSFFWRLSVEENLKFFCSLSNKNSLKKIEEILNLLNIVHKKNYLFMNLSYGERKKISIARALLRNSKILLLDEITNSLDIDAKKIVISSLRSLLKNGYLKLIIFATHSLDEVVSFSNRFIVIKDKKIYKDMTISKKTKVSDIEKFF